ncbi:MORN repeat-containing protein [Leptospira semungkisensis]|uniref:MORN repeat-containing protein n=1 Tax=Leptospira semungkisensis TaxID=2484985 RepID=UPI001FE512C0|nr:hypothetical protein [Leptospira semungkisensis]
MGFLNTFFSKIKTLERKEIAEGIRSFLFPFRWKNYAIVSVLLLVFLIICLRIYNAPKCVYRDCKNGLSKLEYSDGGMYEGVLQDSKPNGKGVFWNEKGDYYAGEWLQGLKHGMGTYRYPNGSSYEGRFVMNRKEGNGTFTWADGTSLKGLWVADRPEGNGSLTLPDGTVLGGEYREGRIFNGKGIFVYPDASRYIGGWKDGRKHGKGILMGPLGTIIFEGDWVDGERKYPGPVAPSETEENNEPHPHKQEKHSKKGKKK